MDYELMEADRAIVVEDAKRRISGHLPPQAPFGSRRGSTLVTPWPGAGSLGDIP